MIGFMIIAAMAGWWGQEQEMDLEMEVIDIPKQLGCSRSRAPRVYSVLFRRLQEFQHVVDGGDHLFLFGTVDRRLEIDECHAPIRAGFYT